MPKLNRKLTETEIRNAKAQAKNYKLYDENGLRLLVRPTGTKVWQYHYRYNNKWNTLTIGKHGDIGSADARKQRDAARRLLKEGIDPNQHKKSVLIHREYENRNSFQAIALEWYGTQNWAPKHAANILSRLELDVFPLIGAKPITKITRPEVLHVLKKIEKRGALDVAKRISQYCVSIFDYGINTGLFDYNPALGLGKNIKGHVRQNRAYLKEDQLPEFLANLEEYRGSELVKLAMKLLMHTFVRPGELRGARWDEINIDKAEWRIPASRMKMKDEHIVPLSQQSLSIIEEIRKISGRYEILFPGVKNAKTPISDVTLTKCLIIMGYRGKVTPHGMRATASTILNEHDFISDHIERQLAHIPRNKVRGAYNHAQHLSERRKMMQWWSNHLSAQGK